MFRQNLPQHEGLLLVEKHESRMNSAIHMLFMKFDLAVIWIDSQYRVVDVQHALPWKISYFPLGAAQYTLEAHPERLNDFHIGDQLSFEKLETNSR